MPDPSATQRRYQDLLLYPQEDLDVEIKSWIDLTNNQGKANLAHAMLALANFGGGYIIVGFTEVDGSFVPDTSRPPDLSNYSQDLINGIVQRYAEPIFHCDVQHVAHPDSGDLYPVVSVPGEHGVPIRCKRDGPEQQHVRQHTYYTRVPGPRSAPVESARDWDDIISRCIRSSRTDLVDSIRDILLGVQPPETVEDRVSTLESTLDEWMDESRTRWLAVVSERFPDEEPSRYSHGTWTVGYVVGDATRTDSLGHLKETLEKVEGRITGWPPWWVPSRGELRPRPVDGALECLLGEQGQPDPGHSDYWRASPQGLLYLVRGFQEDGATNRSASGFVEPGTILDLTLPVWRTAECLIHAKRFAIEYADEQAPIVFRASWSGLEGRVLTAWADRMRARGYNHRRAYQDSTTTEIQTTAEQIITNLPELVHSLTLPVYELFDLYSPGVEFAKHEIDRMMKKEY